CSRRFRADRNPPNWQERHRFAVLFFVHWQTHRRARYIKGMKAVQPQTTVPDETTPVIAPASESQADARATMATAVSRAAFSALLDNLGYLDSASIEQVRQAYLFADEAHTDQWRSSGDPYITHPIAVTSLCASWKLDAPALMAALMHDAM